MRGSRLAGALFKRDGQLFRTAQDGTIRYGRRVALYLVEELTPTSYKETFVRYIEPIGKTRSIVSIPITYMIKLSYLMSQEINCVLLYNH